MKTYNKLVRDNIPKIIQKEGRVCNTRVLSNEEYKKELDKKLIEELKEYEEAGDIKELADIQEIINAIVSSKGLTLEEFNEIREEKRETNGGFDDKIFLIDVEEKK